MIKKLCSFCNQETFHNPLKKTASGQEQQYRCTNCGWPRRFGRKNFAIKLVPGGKVQFIPAV